MFDMNDQFRAQADKMPRKERIEYLKRHGLYKKTSLGSVLGVILFFVIMIGLAFAGAAWSSYNSRQQFKAQCVSAEQYGLQQVQTGNLQPSQVLIPPGCPKY
jgi:hypothetical protein